MCRACGKHYISRRVTKLSLCSDKCAYEDNLRQKREKYQRETEYLRGRRPCVECGAEFKPRHARAVLCSVKCAQSNHHHNHATHGRRARKYGVPREPVSPARVFERDGWKCYICGCDTPRHLMGALDDSAPTLDHVIPMSVGGGHLMNNVRCCCWVCNTLKGVMPEKEFLSWNQAPG